MASMNSGVNRSFSRPRRSRCLSTSKVAMRLDQAKKLVPGVKRSAFLHTTRLVSCRISSASVGRPTDAEEILQETNLVVWRKADRFTPGTSFFAWSSRIATFEVLKHRERRGREKLRFTPEFIDAIARDAAEASENWEERRRALSACLGKLRPRDRELVERRYAPGENGKSVAEDLGRPINAVYQSLGRIRRTLMECVNRQLATLASQ